MGKIDHLPGQRWSAHAALYDAIESIKETDKVLVIFEKEDGSSGHRSANMTMSEGVFLMEKRKFNMFFDFEDGEGA